MALYFHPHFSTKIFLSLPHKKCQTEKLTGSSKLLSSLDGSCTVDCQCRELSQISRSSSKFSKPASLMHSPVKSPWSHIWETVKSKSKNK